MKISFRLGLTGFQPYREDARFQGVVAQAERWKDLIDEVCLFTESWHHGYVSPEHIEQMQPVLEKRMDMLRAIGIPSVGLNILETVGQLDEGWDWLDPVPFQTMVGHDGSTSFGMMCIRSKEYRNYIRYKYMRYAQSRPDFIWLDDDIRPGGHKPVDYPCFCHNCITEFNQRMHTSFCREELVRALDSADGGELRQAWTGFIREGYDDLMNIIRETVHRVDPAIQLGLMTIQVHGDTYGQADHIGLLRALDASKIRPGEGFYDDYTPADFALKALYVADQLRECPPIQDRQYELEDFPGMGKKSVRMHMIELTAGLLSGCNGAALNFHPAFDPDETPSLSTDGLLSAMVQHRQQWHHMVRAGDSWKLYGGTVAFDKLFDAKYPADGDWFQGKARKCWEREISFFAKGLPYTPYAENAAWFALSEEMADVLDDDQIRRILAKGAWLDGGAVSRLCRRGFGDLIGCEIERSYSSGMRETFNSDPRNGAMRGRVRDVYQTFYRWNDGYTTVYSLRTDKDATVLSTLSSITGVECGTAGCAYENKLGGRVICCGYLPWRLPELTRRNDQIRQYADWLSRDAMPVRLYNVNRVFPLYKRSEDKHGFMLMLVNCCLDATEAFSVRVDAVPQGKILQYDTGGAAHEFSAWQPSENGTLLQIPSMQPWEYTVLLCE